MASNDTKISDAYRAQQAELHRTNPNYGVASVKFAPMVAQVLKQVDARELLDYGAGKGRLEGALAKLLKPAPIVHKYDPAIAAWSADPNPCPFVCCIDVLEHIEPESLEAVLDDLKRVTTKVGVFTVHTGPAVKTLPDGRNAHLIQQPPRWWLEKVLARFELNMFQKVPGGFFVIVEPAG